MANSVLLQSLGNGTILDANGNGLNGHLIYVYQRSTVTPIPVFSDAALSVSLSQPLSTGSGTAGPGGVPGYVAAEQALDLFDSTASLRMPAEPLAVNDLIGTDGRLGGTGSLGLPASVEVGAQFAAGSLGASYTVDLGSAPNKQVEVVGTLNANCTVTVSNRAAGGRVVLLLTQDGTGGHTLTISDGSATQLIALGSAASATSVVVIDCPNSTDLYVSMLGPGGLPASVGTGTPPSPSWLLQAWTLAGSFRLVSATRDANEAVTTASVVWPDGATGTYTADTLSSAFPGATDAYHVTYVYGAGPTTVTITQAAVTRDDFGSVSAQPALTVV